MEIQEDAPQLAPIMVPTTQSSKGRKTSYVDGEGVMHKLTCFWNLNGIAQAVLGNLRSSHAFVLTPLNSSGLYRSRKLGWTLRCEIKEAGDFHRTR